MDDRLRRLLSQLVSPEFAVKVSLLTLPPSGHRPQAPDPAQPPERRT